jgi:hypothetical protein
MKTVDPAIDPTIRIQTLTREYSRTGSILVTWSIWTAAPAL